MMYGRSSCGMPGASRGPYRILAALLIAVIMLWQAGRHRDWYLAGGVILGVLAGLLICTMRRRAYGGPRGQ